MECIGYGDGILVAGGKLRRPDFSEDEMPDFTAKMVGQDGRDPG